MKDSGTIIPGHGYIINKYYYNCINIKEGFLIKLV